MTDQWVSWAPIITDQLAVIIILVGDPALLHLGHRYRRSSCFRAMQGSHPRNRVASLGWCLPTLGSGVELGCRQQMFGIRLVSAASCHFTQGEQTSRFFFLVPKPYRHSECIKQIIMTRRHPL